MYLSDELKLTSGQVSLCLFAAVFTGAVGALSAKTLNERKWSIRLQLCLGIIFYMATLLFFPAIPKKSFLGAFGALALCGFGIGIWYSSSRTNCAQGIPQGQEAKYYGM